MANLKSAIRSLLATPVTTVVVLATLAIAIAANTAIFSVIDGVLLRPLGYGDDSRVVVLWGTHGTDDSELFRLSPADYRDVQTGSESFDGQVALYRSIGSTLTATEPAARVGSLAVTPRLFSVLGARPAVGQFFTDADGKPGGGKTLVLTHASWTRRFGADPGIVGSTIELDSEAHLVLGVTEEGFQFPPGNSKVEMYFPMKLSDRILLDRDHRMFDGVARLGDGISNEQAQAELDAMAARLAAEYPDSNSDWGILAKPLREEVLGELGPTLWILAAAVFLVLIVACANIANLLVARSTAASREFAVRAALGAGRGDLLRRSIAESAILGVLGWGSGVLLAYWCVGLLRKAMPQDIPRADSISISAAGLLFALFLSLAATALFGSFPALRSMAPNLLQVLKPAGASGSVGGAGRRLRESMVVVEVALAVVLLVVAGLVLRSFERMNQVDPGFRQEGVVALALQLPGSRYSRTEWLGFYQRFADRMAEVPGIGRVGGVSDLPMSSVGLGFEQEFTVPGLDSLTSAARANADLRLTLPGYFEAMGMQIVGGRSFDRLDATRDRRIAIVNETLARRYFKEVDPVGRTLNLEMLGEVDIVGVVGDIRHGGLLAKHESEIYVPYGAPIATAEMHIVMESELNSSDVAVAAGGVLSEMDPQLAITGVEAMSDLLWQSVARPRFNATLLGGLALCAGLLAMVGIYGIVAYTVARRRNEIGVRMALGADSRTTVIMVVRQALIMVSVGAGAGVLLALGASRFLDRLLFETEPTDPLTYGVIVATALLVGLMAALAPARRATRIDPVTALRDD